MFMGFPEWTALFCAWKTTGKDRSEAWAIACQNCAVYSFFPSVMASYSKISQFNWECIAPFTLSVQCRSCWLLTCACEGRQPRSRFSAEIYIRRYSRYSSCIFI